MPHRSEKVYHPKKNIFLQLPLNPESSKDIEKGFKFPRWKLIVSILLCKVYNLDRNITITKQNMSIVLQALVDSDYKFLFADIGNQGRIIDSGVFLNSFLWQKICPSDLNLPSAALLPGLIIDVPYVFLTDGAFALTTHILKPNPGENNSGSPEGVFNNKLSSSRVV